MQDQKIDLKEIETNHLGTERECQIPEKKDSKASAPKRWSNLLNFIVYYTDTLFKSFKIVFSNRIKKLFSC